MSGPLSPKKTAGYVWASREQLQDARARPCRTVLEIAAHYGITLEGL